jgi:antitoxin component of MazEF toxin-antitoxin module
MIKKLTRTGNSRTLNITKAWREVLGVEDDVVDVQIMGNKIIISKPTPQSFEDAIEATFGQYDTALRNLKD